MYAATRIGIIGNSGSGKSTLARQVANTANMPILDLDTVYWEPGQPGVQAPWATSTALLNTFVNSHDSWIVEGCYEDLIATIANKLTFLLFIDPGLEQCLSNCRNRPWESHKFASKAEQDAHLDNLLDWVEAYYSSEGHMSYEHQNRFFNQHPGHKRRISNADELDKSQL